MNSINAATAHQHGVSPQTPNSILNSLRFKSPGVSQSSGKKLLKCPNMADIIKVSSDSAEFCTPGTFFMLSAIPTSHEYFLSQFVQNIQQQQYGYYIANHINARSRFVGESWDKAVENLTDKYLGVDPFNAITNTPPDCSQENIVSTFISRHFQDLGRN